MDWKALGCPPCSRYREKYREEIKVDIYRGIDLEDFYFERDKDGKRFIKKQWKCDVCKDDCGWTHDQFMAYTARIKNGTNGFDEDWQNKVDTKRAERAGQVIGDNLPSRKL